MSCNYLFESKKDNRHKVFLSYYHKDDQYYRNRFEELFGHLFLSKSVEPGDIDADVSTEYIKRLIQKNYIEDTSVLVVLVGPKTYGRKHVDWEISAALNKKVGGGYSGLLGLCLPTHPDFGKKYINPPAIDLILSLPTHPDYGKDKYNADVVPQRLVDNLKSGYAKFYDWTEEEAKIKKWIEEAFQARINKAGKIDNSREQFKYNRCE
jgi:hypothetical protein